MELPTFSHAEVRVWDDRHPEFLVFVQATDPQRCGSVEWFRENRQTILDTLARFGVVFFRGFQVGRDRFEAVFDSIDPNQMAVLGGFNPRTNVGGSVYTTTDAPAACDIPQHHEFAYFNQTPRLVAFCCVTPASQGGNTPVHDGRRFFRDAQRQAPEVIQKLQDTGVLYVRNYLPASVKSLTTTWGSEDEAVVQQRMRDAGVEWETTKEGWVRTRQWRPAVADSSTLQAPVLFASVNLWHHIFMRESLAAYDAIGAPTPQWQGENQQPFVTYYGDGSRIPEDFILWMNRTLLEQRVAVPWQPQDLMVINNFVAGHGKTGFPGGPRSILASFRSPTENILRG